MTDILLKTLVLQLNSGNKMNYHLLIANLQFNEKYLQTIKESITQHARSFAGIKKYVDYVIIHTPNFRYKVLYNTR